MGLDWMTTTQLLDYDRAVGRGLDMKGLSDSQRRTLLAERRTVRKLLETRHVTNQN